MTDGTIERPPDTKTKMKTIQRKKYTTIMKTLLLVSSIPQFNQAQDIRIANKLHAFVNAEGILQTNKLSNHLINDLQGMISKNKMESILPNAKVQTGIIDTGSSIICFPYADNFDPTTLKALTKPRNMSGIAGDCAITHEGIKNFETIDTKGRIVHIKRKGFLVPKLPVRLLPPQQLMQNEYNEWYNITNKRAIMEFKNGQHVNTPINHQTKLPYIFLFKDLKGSIDTINRSFYTCVAKENNQNLSETQKSTLKLHWRIGHKSLEYIKWISRRGILGSHGDRIHKITSNDCPKCGTCIYSKQTTNPSITRTHKQTQEQHHLNLKKLHLGDMIATDQFEISKAGRLFGTAGRESLNKKYCGGTIFYCPAAKIIKVYFQTSLNAAETIVSKINSNALWENMGLT